jgi:hypothetical protein
MVTACNMLGEKEKFIQSFGGRARNKETTRKTKM